MNANGREKKKSIETAIKVIAIFMFSHNYSDENSFEHENEYKNGKIHTSFVCCTLKRF